MGYNTRYKLSTDSDDNEDIIRQAAELDEDLRYAVGLTGDGGEACKWYDHENDMKTTSKVFPGVLFTLHGAGEESGDLWVKYFRDGKMQVCEAQITFAPFDPEELK